KALTPMPKRQPDPYHLERFVNAQDGMFDRALAELQRGRKMTHWMWFIFPQIRGLGHSEMAQRYAISSLAEAKAYLDHPVLGARLIECAGMSRGCEPLAPRRSSVPWTP